jgi:hypothetical protein
LLILEIPVNEAVRKILKHINKQDKFSKCLDLLKTVMLKLETIEPVIVVKIFHSILSVPFKFQETKTIEGTILYITLELLNYVLNENDRLQHVKDDYLKLFEQYKIIRLQIGLITDDSFKVLLLIILV